ncbi:MAG: histidine--tRNA ligase [Candidatus Aenigmatarchaeota archaeon]
MSFDRPRGTRDFLPEDQITRQEVFERISDVFQRYGFDPLETPAFEKLETLTEKSGEDVQEELYSFEDKGGRNLGLRFDLTVPLARVVANNREIPKPFKRYCISRVWRYERPRKGRYREFWQADIDTVGVKSIEADVECVMAGIEALESVGLSNFVVKISNRKLAEGLVLKAGVDEELVDEAFRAIDKLEKIGEEGVKKELKERGIDEGTIPKIMEFLEIEGDNERVLERVEELLDGIDVGLEGIEELERFLEISQSYGMEADIDVDISLMRGLDYYTGNVFEVFSKDKDYPSLGGGGRYDNLVETFSKEDEPAVGFSIGVEPLIDILKEEDRLDIDRTKSEVMVVPVSDSVLDVCRNLVSDLRDKNVPSEISLKDRSISSNLSYCDSMGIQTVVIVGERDMEEDKVTLKDMDSGEERLISLDDVAKEVKESI